MSTEKKFLRPRDFLELNLGRYIIVRLKGNKYVRGQLESFDIHLNLTLSSAQEISLNPNIQPKDLGKIIVRGDNVTFLIFPS